MNFGIPADSARRATSRRTSRHHWLVRVAASALAPALLIAPAAAQAARQMAEREFVISSQPLATALLQVSLQGNVDVIAPEQLTRGRTAPSVRGLMTPERALSRVLGKADLSHRTGVDGSFIVERRGAPERYAQNSATPPMATPSREDALPAAAPAPVEEGPADDGAAAEIIVTAQRRSESLQKVPISINAFNQDTLTTLNIRSTDQIQFATPGLVNTATAGDGIAAVYIRGVGTGYSGPGLEGSVAFYLDDVYLQTQTSSAQNSVDIAQIQVLKGPQGTLYGRNATGGAVVVTTADPRLGMVEGYVKAGYGNLDWKRGEAVLNLPLGSTVAARFAGYYENRNGYVRNVAVDNEKSGVGAGDTYGARLKLLWEPSPDFNAVAKVSYDRRNGNGAIHSLRYNSNGTRTSLGFYETSQSLNREGGGGDDSNALMGSLRLEYTLDTWTVSNTLAYRRTRSFGCTDNDGLPEENLYFCLVSQRSDDDRGAHGREERTLTNEFRVVSNNDGPLDVTAGLFFERNRARFVGRVGGAFFGPALPTFDNRDNLTAYSGFVELYYKVTDELKLTGGLRYTHERKYHSVDLDPDGSNTTMVFGEQKKSFSNVLPRFVASYNAGDWNYYASYSRGFKSGGFNSPGFGLDPPLKPETIRAFEVGTKYRSPDGRIRVSSALYDYKWKDVQVAFITGGGAGIQQQNAAGAHIYGGELNLDWKPSRNWQFNAGAAYTHGRFTNFTNAAVYNVIGGSLNATAENLKGFRLPQAPDFTTNGSATYSFDLPSDWSGAVTIAARYATQYDYAAGAGGELRASRQKAFGLVNLSGSFVTPGKNIELGWFVSNLFQQHYLSLISTGNTGVYMTPAEPRLFGGTVRYGF